MGRLSPGVLPLLAGALIVSTAARTSAQSVTPSYGLSRLPTVGGGSNAALAISCTTFPFIVGWSTDAAGFTHAFTTNVATTRDLGTLGGASSDARATYCGITVGAAQTSSGAWHAYIVTNTTLADLGTLGGTDSYANGITFSNTYVVVGGSRTSGDSTWRAFIWQNNAMADLGATLGGANTYANAINSAQHVVGWAEIPGGARHAFLYANAQTIDVGSLGGNSQAFALNDNDVVVGAADVPGTSATHAFRYQGGSFQDLGTLGGASSAALGVNNRGDIVGWSLTSDGARHAFLWRDGVMADLNTMIRPDTGFVLEVASGVDVRGAVTGFGPSVGGATRAFLLTPPMDLRLDLHPHRNQLDTNFPNPHEAGQANMTMGVTIKNLGAAASPPTAPYRATGVVVVDTLTGPVEILGWRYAKSCTSTGPLQLTCTLPTFDFDQDLMIDFRSTGPGTITHSATIVSSDALDLNSSNDSGTESNVAVSLSSLALDPTTILGGESALATVQITSRAPTGGATVRLSSSDPSLATVLSQIDILPTDPNNSRQFYVNTKPVSAPVTVQINATYGLVTKTVPLTIMPQGTHWPFTGDGLAIPGTIQAEDFDGGGEGGSYHDTGAGNDGGAYRNTDVDIQATSDVGGGVNVGWIDQGEWLIYTVNVATTGSYALEARVAAPGGGGTFHVEIDGVDKSGPLSIPDTGGWQSWATISKAVSLTAGMHTLRVAFDATGPGGFIGNLNYLKFSSASGGGGGSTPFGGTPRAVPGTVQAEDFDDGGQLVAYRDEEPENNGGEYRDTGVDIQLSGDIGGGFNVGWIRAGEWMNYTVNVAQAGSYTLRARVAAAGSGGTFHIEFDGVDRTGPMTIPDTGDWQVWTDVTATINLPAGVQVMRFVADEKGSVFGNVNYFSIASAAPPPPPTANIVLYASDLGVHGAWFTTADSGAAGGLKALTADAGSSNTSEPQPSPADYVDVSFDAAAGTPYAIWLRLRATGDTKFSDSIWVQFSDAVVNGAPLYQTGTTSGLLVNLESCSGCGVSAWGWQNGAWWLDQATTLTFAQTGRHTIRIQMREDGAQIDQIVLSPSQYLSRPPGAAKDDNTIVPK